MNRIYIYLYTIHQIYWWKQSYVGNYTFIKLYGENIYIYMCMHLVFEMGLASISLSEPYCCEINTRAFMGLLHGSPWCWETPASRTAVRLTVVDIPQQLVDNFAKTSFECYWNSVPKPTRPNKSSITSWIDAWTRCHKDSKVSSIIYLCKSANLRRFRVVI